jgi:hypothetical protein
MAPKLVIRTILKDITMLTENTIIEGLPYFPITFCTTNNPRSDATKHIIPKIRAVSTCSIPNNRYCNADIVEEKKTMKEHVAAVTYKIRKFDCLLYISLLAALINNEMVG